MSEIQGFRHVPYVPRFRPARVTHRVERLFIDARLGIHEKVFAAGDSYASADARAAKHIKDRRGGEPAGE